MRSRNISTRRSIHLCNTYRSAQPAKDERLSAVLRPGWLRTAGTKRRFDQLKPSKKTEMTTFCKKSHFIIAIRKICTIFESRSADRRAPSLNEILEDFKNDEVKSSPTGRGPTPRMWSVMLQFAGVGVFTYIVQGLLQEPHSI